MWQDTMLIGMSAYLYERMKNLIDYAYLHQLYGVPLLAFELGQLSEDACLYNILDKYQNLVSTKVLRRILLFLFYPLLQISACIMSAKPVTVTNFSIFHAVLR